MFLKPIPFVSLLDQRHSLASLAQTRITNALPLPRARPERNKPLIAYDEVEAPSLPLVRNYLEWVQAPATGLILTVPAHMFSQWSLPLAMKLLLTQARLTQLVNVGCEIKSFAAIRPGEKLYLSAEIVNVEENEQRKALSVHVVTRNRRKKIAIDALLHCIVPKQALPDSSKARIAPARQWETAGAWAVDSQDGLRFALLTGDFNPVHWANYAARHSPFGQKILHGFASLSLSWAALEAREGARHSVRQISARFVRPVPLPSSSMYVYRSAARPSGSRRYELKNGDGGLFLFGEYSGA
ncbi:hypothetical protein HDN1F_11770 [gamma proteobacterium HdN1]|nr:hypothetical protein HDN1F_11770 [gamma proteobacterium HdN1]